MLRHVWYLGGKRWGADTNQGPFWENWGVSAGAPAEGGNGFKPVLPLGPGMSSSTVSVRLFLSSLIEYDHTLFFSLRLSPRQTMAAPSTRRLFLGRWMSFAFCLTQVSFYGVLECGMCDCLLLCFPCFFFLFLFAFKARLCLLSVQLSGLFTSSNVSF